MSYIDDFAAQYGLYLRADSPLPFWRIPMTCPSRLDQMQTEISDLKRKAENLARELQEQKQYEANYSVAAELEKLAKDLRERKAWIQSVDRSMRNLRDRTLKTEVRVTAADGGSCTISYVSR